MRGAAAVLALSFTLLAAFGGRQQPQTAPVPVFKTRVDLVVLDVSVLDRERRPVRGLTAADFAVLENERPQRVTMFSAVDVEDPDPPSASWLRDVAPDVRSNTDDADRQIVVLVLDDANPMSAADLMRAKVCARSVIDRLGPRDLGAVVFVADARSGQELTPDRARLYAAVERFAGPAQSKGGVLGALEMLGPVMALRTLKGQAEALADLSTRRKTVIFISVRGAAVPDSIAAEGDAEGQDPPVGVDAAGMAAATLGEFGDFMRAAERASISVYCLDPGGLRAPETQYPLFGTASGATSVHIHNPNVTGVASLQAISANTGGFAIVQTNDPQPGITQVFRERRSYYLLAYAPEAARTEGRFRRVRVLVDRPGVTVRTRSGYFEPTARGSKAWPQGPPTEADVLAGAVASPELPMLITAAPFAQEGGSRAAVAIVVRVEQARPPDRGGAAGVDLLVKAYDYLARERASERIPVKVALRPGAPSPVTYEVLSRLDLEPGRYQLRVAAAVGRRPATSAGQASAPSAASVFCDLDVPDFARLPVSLSGLVLSAPPGLQAGPKDRLRSLMDIVPTTEREFDGADGIAAFVRVYQARSGSAAAVEVRARIVNSRNLTVFDRTDTLSPDRFSAARAADFRLDLPLPGLPRGSYLLSIEARRGNHAARRDVRFAVR